MRAFTNQLAMHVQENQSRGFISNRLPWSAIERRDKSGKVKGNGPHPLRCHRASAISTRGISHTELQVWRSHKAAPRVETSASPYIVFGLDPWPPGIIEDIFALRLGRLCRGTSTETFRGKEGVVADGERLSGYWWLHG